MRVLCFGDSNTHGTPPMVEQGLSARFGPDIRWPCVMAEKLGEAWSLVEEGLPGRTTVFSDPIEGSHMNGLEFLPAIIATHKWIDCLIIMLGTNDHKHRFSLTAHDIAFGVGRLIECAKASPFVSEILVVAPPPVLERGCIAGVFSGAERRVTGLADLIAKQAALHDVAFFDAGGMIESDQIDGVHFSEESHHRLGTAMAEQVKGIWA